MAKETNEKAAAQVNHQSSSNAVVSVSSKKRKAPTNSSAGMDEIESIFLEKKKQAQQTKEMERKIVGKKKNRVNPVANVQKLKLSRKEDRSVLERTFGRGSTRSSAWMDDGLGGKFDREGFTGRVESGVKVFKAHVLNKPGFGQSKDCPFDCDCCFI